MSLQVLVVDGTISCTFASWSGTILPHTVTMPVFAMACNPDTPTAISSTSTSPTDVVACSPVVEIDIIENTLTVPEDTTLEETPVGNTLARAETCSSPNPIEPVSPVSSTIAPPAARTVPTAVVELTPVASTRAPAVTASAPRVLVPLLP